jgi:hypothetical protein
MKIKIIDQKSKYYGMELEGSRIYYDYAHTGNSGDLYMANTDDGKIQFFTRQIDEKHYENQLLEKEVERLGANVRDVVVITRTGSGCYYPSWVVGEHVITKIDSLGHVEFDNGKGTMFRPDVEKIGCGEK